MTLWKLTAAVVLVAAGALVGCGDDGGTDTTGGQGGTGSGTGGGGAGGGTGGGGTGGGPTDKPLEAAAIKGTWASAGCESSDNGMGGKNHLKRTFVVTEATWHLDLDLFGDEACSVGLFSVAIDGPFELGSLSADVPGATEGTFGFTKNVWTAHTEDMAKVFEMSGCGAGAWAVGTPKDVSATGCIGVAHPIADCPEEYDIVSVDGDSLYFGERTTNMCTLEGRPKALAALPVKRQ